MFNTKVGRDYRNKPTLETSVDITKKVHDAGKTLFGTNSVFMVVTTVNEYNGLGSKCLLSSIRIRSFGLTQAVNVYNANIIEASKSVSNYQTAHDQHDEALARSLVVLKDILGVEL